MKKRIMFSICVILIICLAVIVLYIVSSNSSDKSQNKQQNKQGFGMFSWNTSAISKEEDESLKKCINNAGVTQIYQQFSEDVLQNEETKSYIKRMEENNISVYALLGEAEWAYESDADTLIGEIQRVVEYNTNNKSNRICGVMTDVEPYLLDEWDEKGDSRNELMANYLECIKSAYKYAKENKLEFFVCVPTFYDVVCEDVLKSLITDACDGVAVMNYNRTDEYGQIEEEVKLAKENNKKIICIYELQKAGKHELEDINTYAGEGLEMLWRSAKRLKEQFDYSRLSFAYHYYEPLKEMLTEENVSISEVEVDS